MFPLSFFSSNLNIDTPFPTQYNDIYHNETQHNSIQHKDIQHTDSQHNRK
jgi:hypothetical protein